MKFGNAFPRLLLAILVSLILAPWIHAQQTTSTLPEVGILNRPINVFAIENATIVTEPGRSLKKGTLVIRDGKITDVGVGIEIPRDARRLDLSGKWIYPGLIDAGVESDLVPATLSPIAHWSRDITPQRSAAQELAAAESTLAKLRKAGITAALVAPRDGIIKGQSAVITTGTEPLADAIIKPNVAMHLRLTVARGRPRDSYPSSPMGAVALARQTFLDAHWYARAWQAYRAQPGLEKPEENLSLSVLANAIATGQPMIFDALNEQYALRADSFGREFGLNVILKGSGQEYQLLDRIAKTNRTIIVPLNFPKPPNVSSAEQAMDVELEELVHWELAPENPARLERANVHFVFTSNGLSDVAELIPQTRKAIARGLDQQIALAALTTRPAEILGVDDCCGALRRGFWANFIVTDGELFDEKTKLEEVWVKGQRPGDAIKNATSIDGLWNLEFSSNSSGLTSLNLQLSDTMKKATGTVALSNIDLTQSNESEKPKDSEATKKDSENDTSDSSASNSKSKDGDAPSELKEDANKSETDKQKGRAKLKSLRWQDGTLTANFPIESLLKDTKGNAFLTITLVNQDQQPNRLLIGSIVLPDSQVIALRGKPSQDKASTEPAKSDSKKSKSSKEMGDSTLSPNHYPVGSLGRSGLPDQPEYLLFRNATLWTCGPQGLLKGTDLLIHRGTIQAIGDKLQVPENAVIVDASKWQLSPGLIDCHSHMATDSGVNEATQAVTAEVRIGDFIDASDITIYRQLAGGLTMANVLHGSANPIGGQNQVIKLRWGGLYDDLKYKDAPAGIKFALGENVKQSNWGDEAKTRYPQTRMGVEQIFRDRFHAAKRYSAAMKSWNDEPKGLPPRRDLELDALSEILDGKRWIHCHSYRQDEILGLLRVLEENKITIGSLQHILEGYKVADAIAKHGATASSFSDWWAYKFEVIDAIPHNGALMHQQGIVVSFNSDDAELGRHMNHEAAKAMKYGGVNPMDALQFVTLNPAKQLRIDHRVGSIEVGKDADIAVWSGSPLSPMSRCEQTWIDGRKYFDREQDKADRKRDAALHAALVQKVIKSGETGSNRSSLADDPSRLWPHHDEYCHDHDHDDHTHEE